MEGQHAGELFVPFLRRAKAERFSVKALAATASKEVESGAGL
jgi:hypothetical protein